MEFDITLSDLNIMRHAVEYHRWLFSQVEKSLGQRILEIGAGIGNYTALMQERECVVCMEIHPDVAVELRKRFTDRPSIHVYQEDITSPTMLRLAKYHLDSAICFNVLEHIENDTLALRNTWEVLQPGGRLALIVPAIPIIMGTVDRSLGHFRRYTHQTLQNTVLAAGFSIEHIHYMNFPGIFGWLLNNRILHRTEEDPRQIMFYSKKIVPLISRIEKWITPPIGLSLVCISRRDF